MNQDKITEEHVREFMRLPKPILEDMPIESCAWSDGKVVRQGVAVVVCTDGTRTEYIISMEGDSSFDSEMACYIETVLRQRKQIGKAYLSKCAEVRELRDRVSELEGFAEDVRCQIPMGEEHAGEILDELQTSAVSLLGGTNP